jgi:plastocyanin
VAGDLVIHAKNVQYDQTALSIPAGKPFTVGFANDEPVPHNVAIHEGSATGKERFRGEIVTGPTTIVYQVPALEAGAYAFVCTVHPNMVGTLTVQ